MADAVAGFDRLPLDQLLGHQPTEFDDVRRQLHAGDRGRNDLGGHLGDRGTLAFPLDVERQSQLAGGPPFLTVFSAIPMATRLGRAMTARIRFVASSASGRAMASSTGSFAGSSVNARVPPATVGSRGDSRGLS